MLTSMNEIFYIMKSEAIIDELVEQIIVKFLQWTR